MVRRFKPDIVHLHWINDGAVGIGDLDRFGVPLVWTLHDMWPLTGGCHHSHDCRLFEEHCIRCPLLERPLWPDFSRRVFARKLSAWKNLDFSIVSPSQWLARRAASSRLFRDQEISVIGNGIDTRIFKPMDQATARHAWNLPKNRKIILFGALNFCQDQNKGFDLFCESISKINPAAKQDIHIALFGEHNLPESLDLGVPVSNIGKLSDEISLAVLYAAADVMSVPSRAESCGQVAMEAMACGTPVVAFDNSGLADLVTHERDGYLAPAFDTSAFSDGLEWTLEDDNRNSSLREEARAKAEQHFDLRPVVELYRSLYSRILPGTSV
jgi:glycosyltransferase involved in cell wall biosynthesis